MRILVVHNYYANRGGEEVSFESEVELLKERGHEVKVYTKHNKSIVNTSGLKSLAVALRTIWNWTVYRELGELIRDFKPEIVHFHNTFPIISPSAYYVCKKEGVPVVQTLHNFRLLCPSGTLSFNGAIYEGSIGKLFPFDALFRRVYRNSFLGTLAVSLMLFIHRIMRTYNKKVDIYVSLTEFGRKKYELGGIRNYKIVVRPPTVRISLKKNKKIKKYALFIGRFVREKGIEVLLEAWKEINFELRLVGDGPDFDRIKEVIEKNKMSNVKLLGHIDREEIGKEFDGALFSVFPSLSHEAFGLVIVESLAKGVPIIASDISGVSEVVKEGFNGLLFKVGDVEGLRNKINYMINNKSLVLKLGKNAITSFNKDYTDDILYKSLMDIYVKSIKSNRREYEKNINK